MHPLPLLLLLLLPLSTPALTALIPISLSNLSLPTTDLPTYCKPSEPHWHSSPPSTLELADCTAALHRFYNVQVLPHPRTEFEFLALGASPIFRHWPDVAVTPRKYVSGTCVLAVAMIDFYSPEVLPERGEGPFLENDIARYLSLWTRFHDIIFGCQAPGWGAAGADEFIAVMVFATGSDMDRRTPSGTFAYLPYWRRPVGEGRGVGRGKG